jgi:hypothetical protein
MQIKLLYDASGETGTRKYVQLPELPRKGQVLDIGGGIRLEVVEVTPTPKSMFQKAIAVVRRLKAAA